MVVLIDIRKRPPSLLVHLKTMGQNLHSVDAEKNKAEENKLKKCLPRKVGNTSLCQVFSTCVGAPTYGPVSKRPKASFYENQKTKYF